jgi:Na+-driven multidrug efflux pump
MVAHVIPVIAFYQIIDGNACVTAAVIRAKGDQVSGTVRLLYEQIMTILFAQFIGALMNLR